MGKKKKKKKKKKKTRTAEGNEEPQLIDKKTVRVKNGRMDIREYQGNRHDEVKQMNRLRRTARTRCTLGHGTSQ